jgi:uncharacterized protein YdhG (YjbR/CyaY superfamily)
MKKTRDAPGSIDEYIAGFSPDVQKKLKQVRAAIRKAAPGVTETIRYGIPTFFLNENLVHFAAFRSHVGFYPTPSGIRKFKAALIFYKSAKGSVRFPVDKPMPLKLIRDITAFRVREVRTRSPGRMKRR